MTRPRATWAIPAALILGALFWAAVFYAAHLALAQVDLGGSVSCSAGTVSVVTEVITNGIVTHC
jgi:hypothetical protein